ncbi:VOC family protein [Paenibacillus hexagrammi]|uniref:VOC family protein n=1 Tax=Paenibacillus hexagrammi TaxID=2908839 RepID=A0ABY3SHT4_9BACL|nr:VOC family protein [Paenibacillus sp. YPD9-1]UJF32761.1 VOC family protein [Paenibacillus sp. YPD9-1]
MPSPISPKIAGTFIPVRDIERARDWYCRLFGFPSDTPILFGHLCPLPVEGPAVILDTMPMWGGMQPQGAAPYQAPAVMFPTSDIEEAYQYVKNAGVEIVTDIQDGQWFVFKDQDGNHLMVVKEGPGGC